MLGKRILTALVLIPAVILGVLYLPERLLFIIFAVLVLLSADELARLMAQRSMRVRAGYLAVIGAALLLVYMAPSRVQEVLLVLAALWWCALSAYLLRGSTQLPISRLPVWGVLAGGGLLLVVCWSALLMLHRFTAQGPLLVLALLVLIWVADSGAYFCGRAWGRTKLAPAVSPGKTREGLYGALVGAVFMALIFHWFELLPQLGLLDWLPLCIGITLISVGGDLAESLLKRVQGVKDSGQLLPGHGGALDRIDSLIAAAPVCVVGLYWWLGRWS